MRIGVMVMMLKERKIEMNKKTRFFFVITIICIILFSRKSLPVSSQLYSEDTQNNKSNNRL